VVVPGITGDEERRRAAEMKTVGLIGCGRWGQYILRDLRTLGCDVAVVARSAESRTRASHGDATVIVDRAEALPRVDGIIVATPTNIHAATVRAVLDRGVPVFVEKPLCCSLREAETLTRAAPERLFVMDKWRYHSGIEMMRDIVRSQELGPVVGVRSIRVQWGNPHMGSDTIWLLAPHDLAIVLEILGSLPPPRSAVADATGAEGRTLLGQLGTQPWAVIEVSSTSASMRREIRVTCRDGVVVLSNAYSSHLSILRASNAEPIEEHRAIAPDLPLFKELRAFVEFLDGGPPPRSGVDDAVAVVSAIEELRKLAGVQPAVTAR
jgi:predicted dehydrogenase